MQAGKKERKQERKKERKHERKQERRNKARKKESKKARKKERKQARKMCRQQLAGCLGVVSSHALPQAFTNHQVYHLHGLLHRLLAKGRKRVLITYSN